jgi:hypothetical protein
MRVAGAVATGLLVAAVSALGAMHAATRLDRLHVRTDADVVLRAGAHSAREEMENEVGRVLAVLDCAGLDPARAGQLADAQQRVVIARRVYNDAVRDTLALRSHRMVRWLRLAGTAPLPRYFEIAEPALTGYELDGAGA